MRNARLAARGGPVCRAPSRRSRHTGDRSQSAPITSTFPHRTPRARNFTRRFRLSPVGDVCASPERRKIHAPNPDDPKFAPMDAPGDPPEGRPEPPQATAAPRQPPPAGAPGNAVFRALLTAGVDAEAAYTAAREIESMVQEQAANQRGAQMETLAARMDAGNAQLLIQVQTALAATARELMTGFKEDMAAVRAEVKADMAAVRAEVKADMAAVRAGVKADLAAARAEAKADIAELKADIAEVKTGLATVATDVAMLKREVRLIWGALSLLVVTLTAVLVRLFAG